MLKAAELKVAKVLAEMATAQKIAYAGNAPLEYAPREDGDVIRVAGRVWFPVNAKSGDRSWTYYLAKDSGSYRGAFPDELGVAK